MYRFLMTFYLTFVCLSYNEKRKIANQFTFTLNFHEIDIKNVVEAFDKFVRNLNRELELMINEARIFVCVFCVAFLENMSQQIVNENFSHHNVDMSCKSCECSKTERNNLQFDVVERDRYH